MEINRAAFGALAVFGIVAAGGGGDDLIAVGNTGIARGASGADTLVGASGTELFGGAGADLFVAMHRTPGLYAGSDDPVVIGDFVNVPIADPSRMSNRTPCAGQKI